MRKLTYLLTGILLFTSIIIGCNENNSPSSPSPTDSQEPPHQTENNPDTGNQSGLTGTGSTSIDGDADPNTIIQHSSIKEWGFQFNTSNELTALSYGTDTFILERAVMTTPNEESLFISSEALTNDSISILYFTHNPEDKDTLIGQIQTVTHPDVIQEIRDFINNAEEDNILDSYTEIENPEKVDFNIGFYKASYTVEHPFSFFSSGHVSFRNRNSQAYMMIADTAVEGERQMGVNIAIVSNSSPSTISYQEPLYLSFQQPYGAFSKNSNTTGLIEGLNTEGLDPLVMNIDTTTESLPLSFSFSQTLNINDQEAQLQIEVTSDMEPLHFSLGFLNTLRRAGSSFIQSIASLFSFEEDTDNTPTPPSIDRADQIQPLVSTPPQQALREFEQRSAHEAQQQATLEQHNAREAEQAITPTLRFAEGVTVSPSAD